MLLCLSLCLPILSVNLSLSPTNLTRNEAVHVVLGDSIKEFERSLLNYTSSFTRLGYCLDFKVLEKLSFTRGHVARKEQNRFEPRSVLTLGIQM